MQKGSLLEKNYGYLYHNSFHLNKWLVFADKCCRNQKSLTRIEKEQDLDVNFEINPKLQALCDILDGLQSSSKSSSKSKRQKGAKPDDQASLINIPESACETKKKKLLLIAVKTPKNCLDIQRFLISKYAKKNHKIFYEDKLRFILSTHREFTKRQEQLIRRFGTDSNNCLTDDSIECFFMHKLSLLLDQKADRQWKQG